MNSLIKILMVVSFSSQVAFAAALPYSSETINPQTIKIKAKTKPIKIHKEVKELPAKIYSPTLAYGNNIFKEKSPLWIKFQEKGYSTKDIDLRDVSIETAQAVKSETNIDNLLLCLKVKLTGTEEFARYLLYIDMSEILTTENFKTKSLFVDTCGGKSQYPYLKKEKTKDLFNLKFKKGPKILMVSTDKFLFNTQYVDKAGDTFIFTTLNVAIFTSFPLVKEGLEKGHSSVFKIPYEVVSNNHVKVMYQ